MIEATGRSGARNAALGGAKATTGSVATAIRLVPAQQSTAKKPK